MNTRSRQRVRETLKWSATAIFAIFAVLLPSNLLLRYRVTVTPSWSIRIYDGLLAVSANSSRPMAVGAYWLPEDRPHVKFELKHFAITSGGWGLTMPMTLPLALGAVGAAPFWWRDRLERRRKLAGHCRSCGYDRRGLEAAPCPECGAKPALTSPEPATA